MLHFQVPHYKQIGFVPDMNCLHSLFETYWPSYTDASVSKPPFTTVTMSCHLHLTMIHLTTTCRPNLILNLRDHDLMSVVDTKPLNTDSLLQRGAPCVQTRLGTDNFLQHPKYEICTQVICSMYNANTA